MASSTTQNGTVPQVGSVGALYTITPAGWQAINQRVADVIQLQQIPQVVDQYVPNYTALLAACQQWQTATEAGVIGQSAYVGLLAADMVAALQQLQQSVDALAVGDPLTPTDAFIYKVKFGAAAEQATQAQAKLTALAPGVANFVTQNQQANADLQTLEQQGGSGIADAVGPLNTLGTALQGLQAGWSSLITQLQDLSANAPTTNTQELRTDVTSGLAAWTALQQSAAAFAAQANTNN